MTRIVGILGEAGSGKDTIGKILVQEHGYYSLAFADPIKLFCMWMFDWKAERLWGASELRNVQDPGLPFIRCPQCNFVLSKDRHKLTCPMCKRQGPPEDWLTHLSARFALQHLGTEWARALNPHCHIDFALKRARAVAGGVEFDPLYAALPEVVRKERYSRQYRPARVYISDCRFKNEVQAIRAAGGKVYRVIRPAGEDTPQLGIINHPSEMEQRGEIDADDLDGTIMNDATLDVLHVRVHNIVKGL